MKNKKKKGFTLIELLAIIVILAIIAVITVPIILNIIDNSRKGAATDSALGYKDAINKFYVTKLSQDSTYKIPNGTYTVNGTNGYLVGTETLEITISGQKPNSGAVEIENNNVKQACLKFGDYAVTFNGNETSTVKGNCSSSNEQGGTTPSTVKPVIYASKGSTQTKNVSNIAVGDYVKLGDDGFYVINPDRNGNVVLMSEYNISNTASDSSDSTSTGYNAQNNGIMLMSNKTELALADAYRQTSGDSYKPIAFSEEYYWENDFATSSVDCEEKYCLFDSNDAGAYVYDSTSNLYAPMKNYKDYLESTTGLTLKVRAMSYSEAENLVNNSNSYGWAYNQSYWLGSENNDDGVWYVYSNRTLNNDHYYRGDLYGVRPVIEISTSAF